MVLAVCEMKKVSSRIWTQVAMSISYNDSYYTTSTSKYFKLLFLFNNSNYLVGWLVVFYSISVFGYLMTNSVNTDLLDICW